MPFWPWTFVAGLFFSIRETDSATIEHNNQVIGDFLAKYGPEIAMVGILFSLAIFWLI